jgi:hypothetical protein
VGAAEDGRAGRQVPAVAGDQLDVEALRAGVRQVHGGNSQDGRAWYPNTVPTVPVGPCTGAAAKNDPCPWASTDR